MSGLFGTLGVAARSLEAQQAAIAVTGHNLANASNAAYARQRAIIATSSPTPSPIGLIGTGADVTGIQQIRSALLDGQIQSEASTIGYWDEQQQALQYAEASLGEQINTATSTSGTSTQTGIAQSLTDLFNSFQSLSTDPTSMAERQVLLAKAADLASRFNQTAQRFDALRTSLNSALQDDVTQANGLLSDIANLNDQIVTSEMRSSGTANDLHDLRQQKIEELSKLVKIDTATQANGSVNVSISGQLLVSDKHLLNTLQAYDAGGGQYLVRTTTGATALTLTNGSIQGIIGVRDGTLATVSTDLDALASQLIDRVNTVHSAGFSLTGSSHEDFFAGADAHTIAVNPTLLNDAALVQASGTNGVVGDNQVALALAQLANETQTGFNNQTFNQKYNQTVAGLGQAAASANGHVADEATVQSMLQQQRDSVSGVSLDEEMTNLTTYQRAFQASAHLITVVDSMLQTLIDMKQG